MLLTICSNQSIVTIVAWLEERNNCIRRKDPQGSFDAAWLPHTYNWKELKTIRVSDQILAAMYNQTLPHRDETMQKLGNTTEM